MSGVGVSLSFPSFYMTTFALSARRDPQDFFFPRHKSILGEVYQFSCLPSLNQHINGATQLRKHLQIQFLYQQLIKKITNILEAMGVQALLLELCTETEHLQQPRYDILQTIHRYTFKVRIQRKIFQRKASILFAPHNSLHFSFIIFHALLTSCQHAALSYLVTMLLFHLKWRMITRALQPCWALTV